MADSPNPYAPPTTSPEPQLQAGQEQPRTQAQSAGQASVVLFLLSCLIVSTTAFFSNPIVSVLVPVLTALGFVASVAALFLRRGEQGIFALALIGAAFNATLLVLFVTIAVYGPALQR